MRRSPATIERYGEALKWVIRDVGDRPVAMLNVGHVLTLRRAMEQRGCGESRIASILNTLRTFLRFCREVLRLATLDPGQIRVPRIPRRVVVYLTKEEVDQFLTAIVRSEERWDEVALVRVPLSPLPGAFGVHPRRMPWPRARSRPSSGVPCPRGAGGMHPRQHASSPGAGCGSCSPEVAARQRMSGSFAVQRKRRTARPRRTLR